MVWPCTSLAMPKPRVMSSTMRQAPGIQRSPRAVFISLPAPFNVVLNVRLLPAATCEALISIPAAHSVLQYKETKSKRLTPCIGRHLVQPTQAVIIRHGLWMVKIVAILLMHVEQEQAQASWEHTCASTMM